MRALFVTGARLLGILMLFWGLADIPLVLAAWREQPIATESVVMYRNAWAAIPRLSLCATKCLLSLTFASVLLFCPRLLSRLFAIPEQTAQDIPLSADDLLELAIRMIGICLFAHFLAIFARDFVAFWNYDTMAQISRMVYPITSFLLMAMGAGMTFYPKTAKGLIESRETETRLLKEALRSEKQE